MPRAQGGKVKMRMPGMANAGALQAALKRQMEQAQAAQVAETQRTQEASIPLNNPAATGAAPQAVPQGVPQQAAQIRPQAPHPQAQARRVQQLPSWFNGDDRSRSICIYPIYINAEKTVAGGRRVPKEMAVMRPILKEMYMVLNACGFECIGVGSLCILKIICLSFGKPIGSMDCNEAQPTLLSESQNSTPETPSRRILRITADYTSFSKTKTETP